jgi:hypothetical protein
LIDLHRIEGQIDQIGRRTIDAAELFASLPSRSSPDLRHRGGVEPHCDRRENTGGNATRAAGTALARRLGHLAAG